MRVYFLAADDPFPASVTRGAVSFGNFDGVHRGHGALIAALHAKARQLGGPAVAVTFDPHPLRLLAPDRFMPQLTTTKDRANYLLETGADRVVVLQTTPQLLTKSAREFLDAVVRDKLQARAVVEGFNFVFGRGREGDIELLRQWGDSAGVDVDVLEALRTADGAAISSSRVRNALEAGEVDGAMVLLGRPYRLRGIVTHGERRGIGLGFPTANLAECRTVVPSDGVYAAQAHGSFGSRLAAVNIGPNPTFDRLDRKVEAYLLEFSGDLYGQEIAIDFFARLRDTRRFDSKKLLVEQLHDDVEQVRKIIP